MALGLRVGDKVRVLSKAINTTVTKVTHIKTRRGRRKAFEVKALRGRLVFRTNLRKLS